MKKISTETEFNQVVYDAFSKQGGTTFGPVILSKDVIGVVGPACEIAENNSTRICFSPEMKEKGVVDVLVFRSTTSGCGELEPEVPMRHFNRSITPCPDSLETRWAGRPLKNGKREKRSFPLD